MQQYKSYRVQNGTNEPFTISVKSGGRIHDTLEALRKGPFPAPSLRRVSDHVFRLRSDGLIIHTEYRQQREDSADRFGIYHLVSKVTPIADRREEAA